MKPLLLIFSIALLACTQQKQEDDKKSFTPVTEDNSHLPFPERCIGEWEGYMKIYVKGSVVDSIFTKFTCKKTDVENEFIWKTEYLSEKQPVIKDYKLIKDKNNKGVYKLNEGNEITLLLTEGENQIHSTFKVDEFVLNSTNQLLNDKLIFEIVTSKPQDTIDQVINYSILNIQRTEFIRVNN